MRQLLKKYTGIFYVLLLLLVTAMNSHAQSVQVIGSSLDSNKIAVNNTVTVTDDTYFNPIKHPKLETPYSVKNVITLKINEYSRLSLPATFTASVKVRITYATSDTTTDTISQTLAINYTATDAYTSRSSFVFNNSHQVKVEVLSVNVNAAKDILPALTLENEMYLKLTYKMEYTDAIKILTTKGLTEGGDELEVSWEPAEGADVYDLEWTYIDSTALYRYGTPLDTEALFRNNATRVTITGHTYNIPLIFDARGVVFYRVRSVQERTGNVRIETAWSSKYPDGLGRYDFNGHERKLNWQSAINFAEEGKRKVVVNYFDGSLHSRQTVTKDNITHTAVVAETMYDYQGRPAIQVMPAPTLVNAVKYFKEFNNAANGAEYDKSQYDSMTVGVPAMSSLSGANLYYSPNNPDTATRANRFLPNANGYAFAQTEYTQDNTGRISRQSGVGEVFKLGSNHETRFMYGSPAQEELDLLFGTDVGEKTHYFKNSVRDANGQIAVTYVDMHGRTIATALAGKADSANLNGLPGVTGLSYIDTLSGPGRNVIKDLTLENTQSQLVPIEGLYTFRYKLDTPSVKLQTCPTGPVIKFPVLYDLEITITDDVNNSSLPDSLPYVRVLRNYTPGIDPLANIKAKNIDTSFSIQLKRGNYQITKRLVVNSDALAYYRDSIFMTRLCKTLNDFVNDQRYLQSTTECLPSCQACLVKIGTWDNYRANYMSVNQVRDTAASRGAAWAAYSVAVDACNALCDSVAQSTDVLKQLLQDVTPPSGQYAMPDNLSIYSIFYTDGVPNTKQVPYQDSLLVYLDANGKRDTVYDEKSGAWVIPQKLTVEQFGAKFKPSWANALLKYHPEYCRYLAYLKFKDSYDWDDKFSKTELYYQADNAGYLNPLGDATYNYFTTVAAKADPITQNTKIANALKQVMASYPDKSTGASIYTMAVVRLKCPEDGSCISANKTPQQAFGGLTCSPDYDMAWRTFREMYLTAKHNLIDAEIDAANCSGIKKVSSDELMNAGFQTVFNTASKVLASKGPSYLGTDTAKAKTAIRAEKDTLYAQNCRAYIADWIGKLSPCIDSLALTDTIIPRLVEVCKQGSDDNHPLGASSVAPASTYKYRSFQAVLDEYYKSRKNAVAYSCNAYLITAPAPYDQPAPLFDVTIYSKPDTCLCTKLNSLQSEYVNNSSSDVKDTSFAAYLKRTKGISMSQADLELLLNSCNGGGTCVSLANPVTIPPAMQCNSGSSCVTCSAIGILNREYNGKYPGYEPKKSDDSVQLLKNQLFENYMNVRLGFKKHYWEYLEFMETCGADTMEMNSYGSARNTYPVGTQNNVSVSCQNYQQILADFKALHPVSQGDYFAVTKKIPLTSVTHLLNDGSTAFSSTSSLAAGIVLEGGTKSVLRDNLNFNWAIIARDALISSASISLYARVGQDLISSGGVISRASQFDLSSGNASNAHRNGSGGLIYAYFERATDSALANVSVWAKGAGSTAKNRLAVGAFPVGYSNSNYINQPCTELVKDVFGRFIGYNNQGLIFRLSNEDTSSYKNIVFWGKTDSAAATPAYLTVTYTASRCEEFTAYYNERTGNTGKTSDVNAAYYKVCGNFPGICDPGFEPTNGPMLCGKESAVFASVPDLISNCSDSAFFVYSKGYEIYNAYRDSLRNNFDKIYRDTAIAGGQRELYTLGYSTSEYQYTLYYYDQAGNLTRTVPPAGVAIDRSAAWKAKLAAARKAGTSWTPGHQMATEYRYNTLNQVLSKKTPDDSISNYWYDKLGRVVVSQNAKQALTKNYSYTNYDALGRVVEVGELSSATAMTSTISRNEQSLASWFNAAAATRTDITKTVYDIAYYASDTILNQDNLRNRVSWTAIFDNAAALSTANGLDYASGIFYSYDIHGNVKSLLQDFRHGNMLINGNRFKTINYGYDLISGKVNYVAYQPGKKDAFYHRYRYDAENRLTNVETSHDSIYWENDAYYEYYKHGPLARAVIGQQQVQGIDYAYTLQGWLKGINSTVLRPSFDMGGDGKNGSQVAKDAFGFAIHYFDNRDYTPVSAAIKPFAAAVSNSPLFNGNISAISQSVSTLGTPLEYRYSYDVLNRLTALVPAKGLDTLQNSWTNGFGSVPDFKEVITYDPNGNILSYIRNGNKTFAGSSIGMDSLTYHYRPGTNKLSYVTDLVKGGNYGNDIDNQQVDNYRYDSIGNMVSDVRAGVDSIKWNVYGKIARIYKHDTTSIIYAYDAAGNRISKSVISKAKDTVQTFYVRDATGNILSTYAYRDTSVNKGQLSQIEVNLFGSSRLGMTTLATNVQDPTPAPKTNMIGLGFGENITFTRGKKFFELTNHLGNVLATVSDRKVGVSVNNATIDSYNPVINSAQEYYPFGMLMPGRGGRIGVGKNVAGSTVIVGGDTIPATLVVNQRAGNTPGVYMAKEVIDFVDGFISADEDSFTTVIVDQAMADPGTESGVSYGIDGKGYRYGFNGKENDGEVKGEGNEQDYGMRVYDPRIGKFLSVDPLTMLYPHYTPYQFAGNTPLQAIDLDGAEEWKVTNKKGEQGEVANGPWKNPEEAQKAVDAGMIVPQKAVIQGANNKLYKKENKNNVEKKSTSSFKEAINSLYFIWSMITFDPSQPTASQPNSTTPAGQVLDMVVPMIPYEAIFEGTIGKYILNATPAIKKAAPIVNKVTRYLEMMKPKDEYDVVKTLYRGTTGSETGGTIIFLTEDPKVALTYVKNGGQVMQYQISKISIKLLEMSGELELKTGIHTISGTVNNEYMFKGKEIVEALNKLATPTK
ncbi:RHS repeat protein [Chitinophaga sancti]|uniref:RHS repeat-associated core domain-containing protein n=1 Tax=Chitinophaga sancti TaxID=1004 RepID=A0A1K1SC87_9BACT|nr:RHS repeat-associated core domain-containing protein [Chitinophaga sancti]WQD63580.1 RHS repeat-associated core domain-containing protein [Chitinophaga sancti]WQG90794.1 RHS repeat-associated core domain-containing protein [Chitinophaga sancti]SFW81842.1 hypothetical protein SAMN05661012_05151 [Chitinophaga sancti]